MGESWSLFPPRAGKRGQEIMSELVCKPNEPTICSAEVKWRRRLCMERTVLYYPTISIPDSWWLRQALLYFDKVASIVPQTMTWGGESLDTLIPLTPELQFLQQEGIFRPISPEHLTLGRGWTE